ncbi:hypothetical protein J5N97_028885 [Dioscorea zingiberensis]|uniref:Uncharacterized protein n=1 Tax=Dioscorea zingiberensis TaxID=325984 RepID=A0A9D5BZV3_9LILI|nr:hypothetical protein J5N97_028885 [Dioscorea zingiberensis]
MEHTWPHHNVSPSLPLFYLCSLSTCPFACFAFRLAFHPCSSPPPLTRRTTKDSVFLAILPANSPVGVQLPCGLSDPIRIYPSAAVSVQGKSP